MFYNDFLGYTLGTQIATDLANSTRKQFTLSWPPVWVNAQEGCFAHRVTMIGKYLGTPQPLFISQYFGNLITKNKRSPMNLDLAHATNLSLHFFGLFSSDIGHEFEILLYLLAVVSLSV